MKIWYFHHYATPYEIAGMHRPFDFGKTFLQKGHEVTVFASSYLHYCGDNMIEGKEKRLVKEYDGVTAVFVRTCGYTSKLSRVRNMTQYARRVVRSAKWYAKEKGKPDIIIASSPHPLTLLAGLKAAKKFGVPCVCEIRDFWPEVFFFGGLVKEKSLLGRFLLRMERRIYEKADKLVFLKEGDHTYITDRKWDKAQGGKIDMAKCAYINNGVDLQLFDKMIEESPVDDADLQADTFKIVYCGTIRPVNDIGRLLDVAKLLGEKASVLIYGTGNCVADLERRIVEEGIANVKLKGRVDNKYVPYILSRASLNILNYSGSNYNWSRGNSSNKLFEYFASGKPVVATIKMGYDLIERYGCGISVADGTAENIAAAIEEIRALSQQDYEEACAGARRAAEDFDIPKLAAKYEEVLRETVEKDRRKNSD